MGLLNSGYRDTAVRDRMLSDTYSQDDIRNGFRAEIRPPRTALGERVKMAEQAQLMTQALEVLQT